MLGVSLRTAQLWTESGLLEAWKTGGGHRRISRQSVERLLVNPMIDEPARGSLQGQQVDTAPGPLSILVVEDEPTLCLVYELTMSRWDLRPTVKSAYDGYEALVRIGLSPPDMLITDLRMPGMDGFRMIRTLRSQPELAGMTIVVVSGLAPEEIADNGGVPAGIQVLPKPIPFDQLHEIARRVDEQRRSSGIKR